MSITLKHDSTSRTFSPLSVKGFKPGDGHIQLSERREFLDGSVRKAVWGFERVFRIDLGPLTNSADLTFLGNFLKSEAQYIGSYQWESTSGTVTETDVRVLDLHPEFDAPWEVGVELGMRFMLRLREASYRIGWSSGAGGYGFDYSGPYGTTL